MKIFQKLTNYITTKANRALRLMVYPYMTDRGIPIDFRTKDYLELHGKSDFANPTVHSTVKEVAMAVAQTELKFYRKGKANKITKLKRNHALVDLFWNINPVMSRFDFWEATLVYLQLAGESPWALEKMDVFDRPKEIWNLRPDYLRVIPDAKNFIKGYMYETGIGVVGYLPKEIIFHKYFNPTELWRGQSPFAGARQELISEYYRSKHNINFFKQGASPSGIFTTDQTLNDDSYKRLQHELEMNYTGVDRAHRPMLLEQGLKWVQMGINPKDGEFIQQHVLNSESIAGVLNVPSTFAFGSNPSRYGSIQAGREQTKMFWGITIKPLIRKIEETLNTFLVKRYGTDIYAKFDLSEIDAINDTNIEKSLVASRMVEMGIWTPNEARKTLWNMEETEDGKGNTRYVPSNLIEAGTTPTDTTNEPNKDKSNGGNGKLLLEDYIDERLTI